jgi:hypothetical protein
VPRVPGRQKLRGLVEVLVGEGKQLEPGHQPRTIPLPL